METNYENKATLNIDWSITTNVLLKQPDGTVEINTYGDCAKLIAQARILTGNLATTKHCRFQTEQHWTHWNQITQEDIKQFLSKVNDWCQKHLAGTSYHDVKTTIISL